MADPTASVIARATGKEVTLQARGVVQVALGDGVGEGDFLIGVELIVARAAMRAHRSEAGLDRRKGPVLFMSSAMTLSRRATSVAAAERVILGIPGSPSSWCSTVTTPPA